MRRRYIPFVQTIAATLWASALVIGKDLVGVCTVADGDEILANWAERIFRYGRVDLHTTGAEQYESARPTGGVAGAAWVVMSNHQSLLDIPTIVQAFPGRVRMVSKGELAKIPIWGRAMKAGGIVFVDRDDRAQSIQALEKAKQQLREGTSIWIAPEGTRGQPEVLGELKKGGFHVALQLGVPIAPAWITGTADVVAPDSIGVKMNGTVTVRFGAPIATAGRELLEVMQEVRASLLALQCASASSSAG